MPDIRQDRIQELRRQITLGLYETRDKVEVALDRLLRAVGLQR